MTDRNIKLNGSKQHTLNAIAEAILTERPIQIANPYPGLDIKFYNALMNKYGRALKYNENLLEVTSIENSPEKVMREKPFEIDDILALVSAFRMGVKVGFIREANEDFERKLLILRRMGVKFAEDDSGKQSGHLYVQSFKPSKIKFNFMKSNYYLAEFISRVAIICEIETELISKFDIAGFLPDMVYPLALGIDTLEKNLEDSDELEKRLQRLKSAKKEQKYHFRIQSASTEKHDQITLPADPLLSAYCAVMAVIQKAQDVSIGPLIKSDTDKLFARILNRFGVKADFVKIMESDEECYNLHAVEEKLTARKIDEGLLRGCNYVFGPLALLASFLKGKTILRGLAKSSSLWRGRVDGMARILTSAGVRVGEIEDGLVLEPAQEFTDITYHEFDDPYLQLAQFAAAIVINSKPLTTEFFGYGKAFPHFQAALDKLRPAAKSLAS
jgi:5-enolpyruvylshikimate-3-phosphate synthase